MYFSYNADLYPTPANVIEQMLEGLELSNKVVYEPSFGTCAIVNHLATLGLKSIIGSEIDPNLRKLAAGKLTIIGEDFLEITSDQISHVDFIILNPPFSKGVEHILHAYKIAPAGCKVIALCNSETIKNRYSKSREELGTLVDTYGQAQDLGDCFSTAERKTDVKVSLIRLQKPGENNNEFEGFFMDEDEQEQQVNGLMSYNVVRDLVNRYVKAVQIFDDQLETAVRLSEITKGFYGKKLGFQVKQGDQPIERNQFKKDMQKAGWKWIFNKMNMEKHATKGLRDDINKFVEQQQHIPFTMKNIYRMLDMVIQTTGQRMDKAILEVFDNVTKHHDDNRYGLQGWKTNSHYLLTKRFIMPSIITMGYSGLEVTHYSERYEIVDDLIKALCYLTGDNYDNYGSVWHAIRAGKVTNLVNGEKVETPIERGKWFEWSFFRIRAYKVGTVHFEFKDEKVWGLFNQRVAKLKGYPLPEKKSETSYQARQNGHKKAQPAYRPTAQKPIILSTIQI